MEFRYEVTVVPVSDVEAAKQFYADTLGWSLDTDFAPSDSFRVVQVTPPGSAASVSFGTGISAAEPGSYRGMHLVVTDIEAARDELAGRGVDVTGPFWFGPEGQTDGLHPQRQAYGTYLQFGDPDGNVWLVQEVNGRVER
ncbi:MAG: VOC family protein [Thermoleophilaceae bacterium]|nr:VOC family protein [Thermoleophilaceae bacterium]